MEHAQLNQLLPACSLTLFSNDAESRKAFEALSTDWRCANLTIATQKGGMKEAQNFYAANPSPDILIVETSETNTDQLIAALDALAGNCAEGTAAVLIGPENDVNLYRKLTRMGVLDYLVAPVTTERLLDVIGQAVLERFGIADNTMTVVLGSRGGAGTTSVASHLAYGLASMASKKTALCDLLPGRSPLPVLWGVECPGGLADLGKALKNQDIDNLYRLVPKTQDNLHMFTPATDTPFEFALGHDEQLDLLQGLRQHFPHLVYDTAGFTPKILKALIPTAPHVILVTPPTISGLRAAKKLLSQIEPLRGNDSSTIHIVLNKCKELASDELPKKDIAAALGRAPEVEIAYDRHLCARLENGSWLEHGQSKTIASDLLRLIGVNAPGQKQQAPAAKESGLKKLAGWFGE